MSLNTTQSQYETVYCLSTAGKTNAGYDQGSSADRLFAFDYHHSGNLDHLVLTQAKTMSAFIYERKANGNFILVWVYRDCGTLFADYRLRSTMIASQKAFAFDYHHRGNLDHIAVCYPGTGLFLMLTKYNGTITTVFTQENGLGGYDLKSPKDLAFAFDYDHSGKQDHIVLYRPGTGILWIIGSEKGIFLPVFQQGDPNRGIHGRGIGGYDLKSDSDRALAFDYDHSGNLDHIVLYRPGTGTIWILRNRRGCFEAVYRQGDPGLGIGGYDLKSSLDKIIAFDNDASGRADHLVLYRPGRGSIVILKNFSGEFMPVYAQEDGGHGIGGFDLKAEEDLALAFDLHSSGRSHCLTLFRPSAGIICVMDRA